MGVYSEYEIFGRGKILEGGLDVCSRTSSWGVGLEGPDPPLHASAGAAIGSN